MGINMDSDIRRRAHARRSPLSFVRENWRAITLYLVVSGALLLGLTQATEVTVGILQFIGQLLFAMLFLVVQFGALFYILGRGRTYWLKPGETGVYFSDYRGNDQILEVARRTVTLLRGVREFKRMGGETVRGLLLEGPPGTGKSYLAQAMASEAGLPFGYLSAPSLQAMFIGIAPMKVRMLYSKARKMSRRHGGCIIFIDEIDAIGMARANQTGGGMGMGMMGGMFGGGGAGLLNELLMQMDPPNFDNGLFARMLRALGLKKGRAIPPPVLTVGATNLASVLDQALLRPGRFDRKVHVDKPDFEGRKDIIEYYLAKVRHEEMPIDRMGNDTIEYTPVEIKYVINEAVIHAHFDGRDAIAYADFSRARENHEWGLREPIRGLTQEDRRRLAYHEAGHAVAQVKLKQWERLTKVTIIRHGSALGLAAYKPGRGEARAGARGAARQHPGVAGQPRGGRVVHWLADGGRDVRLRARHAHGLPHAERVGHGWQLLLDPAVWAGRVRHRARYEAQDRPDPGPGVPQGEVPAHAVLRRHARPGAIAHRPG